MSKMLVLVSVEDVSSKFENERIAYEFLARQ